MTVRNYRWRERRSIELDGESMTEQAHRDQTDINSIVQRFQRTGVLPEQRQGQYADVTSLQGDFLERVEHARKVIASYGEAVAEYERSKAAAAAAPPEQPSAAEQAA